jgi:4-hydroxy-tetrahydrodipicolinate synthase
MLAGADAFYSVVGGMLPVPALALVRAGQAGNEDEARRLDSMFAPLWETFREFGSLRVMYVLLEALGFGPIEPPRPILPLKAEARERVLAVAAPLMAIAGDLAPSRLP